MRRRSTRLSVEQEGQRTVTGFAGVGVVVVVVDVSVMIPPENSSHT
jgi:hypothetical protein